MARDLLPRPVRPQRPDRRTVVSEGLVLPCGCAWTPGIDKPTYECREHRTCADPCEDIWCPRHSALANAKIQFWICPIEEHHHSYPEPLRETVRWVDNIAYCM